MANVFDKYAKELSTQIDNFEKNCGDVPESVIKHYFVNKHNMDLEDVFFQPDLLMLKKYEIWLNEGNKTW